MQKQWGGWRDAGCETGGSHLGFVEAGRVGSGLCTEGLLWGILLGEVRLPLNDASNAGGCCVKAWVMHSSEAGAGLLFCAVDRDDYQRLPQFIQ